MAFEKLHKRERSRGLKSGRSPGYNLQKEKMKSQNFHRDALFQPPEAALELEWMLQSPQIPDSQVIRTCLTDLYPDLYALAQLLLADRQKAFNVVADTICDTIHQRRHYWVGISARAWIYRFLLKRCKTSQPGGAGLSREALRLVLCETLGLKPVEAAAVLEEKTPRDEKNSPGSTLHLEEERLLHARQHPPAGMPQLFEQVAAYRQPLNTDQLEEIQAVIVQESSRLLRKALIISRLRQLGLVVLVLAGALGVYRIWLSAGKPTPAPSIQIVRITATPDPTVTSTLTANLIISPTLVLSPTPVTIPGTLILEGICSTDLNPAEVPSSAYSAPDSLWAVLNYWQVSLDRDTVRSDLQPAPNGIVSMTEVQSYASARGLKTIFGLAGDSTLVRRLLDAGFPVIAEVGEWVDAGWQARFLTICGYQFYFQNFITAQAEPSQGWRPVIAFDQLNYQWEDLNGPYLVIYDPRQEGVKAKLQAALGELSNSRIGFQLARERADLTAQRTLNAQKRFFAEFNYATALYYLQEFTAAAQAYDRALVSLALLPADTRPDRILWYQNQPYLAYYVAEQYQQVVDLTEPIIRSADGAAPASSYYWHGVANERLGNYDIWLADLEAALLVNPHYAPAREQLDRFHGK